MKRPLSASNAPEGPKIKKHKTEEPKKSIREVEIGIPPDKRRTNGAKPDTIMTDEEGLDVEMAEKMASAKLRKQASASIPEKYGAPHGKLSTGQIWVLDLCEKIVNKSINFKECVNQYADHLDLKQKPSEPIENLGKAKVEHKLLKEQYTEAKMDKALIERSSRLFKRFNEKKLEWVYHAALTEILDYLKKQGKQINSRENFFLHILLSSISQRLGNVNASDTYIKKGWTIYNEARRSTNPEDKWVSELSADDVNQLFARKYRKYAMQISGPGYKQKSPESKMSPEQAVAHKTYIGSEVSQFEHKLDMIEIFKSFRTGTNFSKAILYISALDSLEHNTFGIFASPHIDTPSAQAYYNWKNKVRVKVSDEKDAKALMQESLLHELMHKALDRVFNNVCAPYYKEDVHGKKAYRECMRQVLLNAIDAVFPLNSLEQLDPAEEYRLVNSNGTSSMWVFKHKWSKSMSLDALIENCVGVNALFSNLGLAFCFNNGYILLKNGQRIESRGGIYNPAELHSNLTASLLSALNLVFVEYQVGEIDGEFITNLTDFSLFPNFKDEKMVKPLMDYIETYIIPQMQEYIEGHPRKDQIDEKIIENDAHFLTNLINITSLTHYLTPISTVFVTLYSYMDWSTVNAILGRD